MSFDLYLKTTMNISKILVEPGLFNCCVNRAIIKGGLAKNSRTTDLCNKFT